MPQDGTWRYPGWVRRFVFAPSWVFGHFVILIAVISCMLLARWQWDVSQHTHSLQNLAYALQWPLFAVFFAVMWYRMLRLESEKLDEESAEYEPDSEEPEPPEPNNSAAAAAGANGAAVVDVDRSDAARHAERGRSKAPVSAPLLAPPPASRAAASMKSDREPDMEPDDEDDRDELAAYNRMLAELAVRDQSH